MSTDTRRIKLVVSYDGTDFCGWAAQPERRTVQGTLTEAVRRLAGENIELIGASRTDGGAHAYGQCCHFDWTNPIPTEKLAFILNRSLPTDVRVKHAAVVPETFHARFSAEERIYRYQISSNLDDPFLLRYAHEEPRIPRLNEMQAAANLLIGRHDFRAFTEELSPHVLNTTRELYSVEVGQERGMTQITISGTAFLRGMMRRISGCLLEVGLGRRSLSELEILLGPNRESLHWPVVLPARGLTLQRITYGDPPRDHRHNSI